MSSTAIKRSAADRLRSAPVIGATLALAALVAAIQPTPATAALRALLVLLVVPAALIDLERRIIPNRLTGYGAVAALAIGLALGPAGEPRRLLWAALAGGFLLIAALIHPRGMGMGDVKLTGLLGLLLGPVAMMALLLALLGSIVAAVVLAARHGVQRARKTQLPFGPFLAGGGLIAALVGTQLLHAYLSLGH